MKRLVPLALTALAVSACGHNIGNVADSGTGNDAGSSDGGNDAGTNSCQVQGITPFVCANSAGTYPSCPYNTNTNGIFPDFVLGDGYWDPNMSLTVAPGVDGPSIASSNLATHTLYCAKAAGFRYALIDISGVWCVHCNVEAAELPSGSGADMPAGASVVTWQQKGGIVFSVLVEGNTPGTPATMNDLNAWIAKYHTNYPISLDPQELMVSGVTLQGWPTNIILDLRTMKVVDAAAGGTLQFYTEFGHLLDGP